MNKKQEIVRYNHEYYLKHRENRMKKVECHKCRRLITNEYMKKHQKKSLCIRRSSLLKKIDFGV